LLLLSCGESTDEAPEHCVEPNIKNFVCLEVSFISHQQEKSAEMTMEIS
jgi:hypothetical protein